MPRTRTARHPRPRRVAPFALLLAGAALQGCFAPSDPDSSFVRPEGEVITAGQFEIAPDGDLLIAAQVGMVYGYEGDDPYRQGSQSMRNFHSVLHRRTGGAWTATPFRNVQPDQATFPALVPAPGGDFHVLVRDGASFWRYAPAASGWTRRSAAAILARWDGYFARDPAYRLSDVALRDDSTLMILQNQGGYDFEDYRRGSFVAHGGGPGGESLVLDTSGHFSIFAVHVFAGTAVVAGREYPPGGAVMGNPATEGKVAVYHWRFGEAKAGKTYLTGWDGTGASFHAGPGGPKLILHIGTGFAAFPLDPMGVPGPGQWLLEPETKIGPSTGVLTYALDGAGCFHTVTSRFQAPDDDARVLYIHSTCEPDSRDSLRIPWNRPGMQASLGVHTHLRISREGAPVLALVVQEFGGNKAYSPSRILLAERQDSGWALETVAQK